MKTFAKDLQEIAAHDKINTHRIGVLIEVWRVCGESACQP